MSARVCVNAPRMHHSLTGLASVLDGNNYCNGFPFGSFAGLTQLLYLCVRSSIFFSCAVARMPACLHR
jgi:hypothetical protein